MLDKSYYDNISSRNILNNYAPKDLSNVILNNFSDSSLENMIINSNLENQNIIK